MSAKDTGTNAVSDLRDRLLREAEAWRSNYMQQARSERQRCLEAAEAAERNRRFSPDAASAPSGLSDFAAIQTAPVLTEEVARAPSIPTAPMAQEPERMRPTTSASTSLEARLPPAIPTMPQEAPRIPSFPTSRTEETLRVSSIPTASMPTMRLEPLVTEDAAPDLHAGVSSSPVRTQALGTMPTTPSWSQSDDAAQQEALDILARLATQGPQFTEAEKRLRDLQTQLRAEQVGREDMRNQLTQESNRLAAAQEQVLCLERELDEKEVNLQEAERELEQRDRELQQAILQLQAMKERSMFSPQPQAMLTNGNLAALQPEEDVRFKAMKVRLSERERQLELKDQHISRLLQVLRQQRVEDRELEAEIGLQETERELLQLQSMTREGSIPTNGNLGFQSEEDVRFRAMKVRLSERERQLELKDQHISRLLSVLRQQRVEATGGIDTDAW